MSAPTAMEEKVLGEALAWHRALDADDADWAGYTDWLEADPRHREAYDAIALTDRIVDEHKDRVRAILPPVIEEEISARPSRRPWLYGAIAAGLAVAVAVPLAMTPAADITYATGTRPRHIALAGNIAVDVAPSSTLVLMAGDASRLELTHGEAYFDVAHDPARRLAIKAGGYSVSDIGTRFGINLSGGAVVVGVADGRLTVDPDGPDAAIAVSAGQQLIGLRHGGDTVLTRVGVASIGGWRRGQLSYDDAPLQRVAADISRYLGKTIDVDAGIRDRRFSGVLTVGDGSQLLPALSQVMAVSYRAEGDHIRLGAAAAR